MKSHADSSLSLFDRFLRTIEKSPASDRFLLKISLLVLLLAGIWVVHTINQHYSAITPVRGGTINEGIVGTPRFVNPALAITRADQDITALLYSGLMKIDTDGNLTNDIAEAITLSEDGLTYNVIVRRDMTFHDGTPLTARDVAYTLQLIQNPELKSPLRANWTDVTIEEISEYELNIILEEPYTPFIENFTVGIMPAHAWSSLPIEQLPFSQLNTEPIGSGPFMVSSAVRDTSGLIDSYTLAAFRDTVYNAKINAIKLTFFANEEELLAALQAKTIDTTTYVPLAQISDYSRESYDLVESPLPRLFGIFFNQNRSVILRDSAVREALDVALDRQVLIDTALYGHGVPITHPTTIASNEVESADGNADTATSTPAEKAANILKKGGWLKNNLGLWEKQIDGESRTLQITVRTGNAALFETLLSSIVSQWKAVGIEVITEQFEQTGLVQSVIRPRDFEALLFGIDASRSHDLYPFWHSSQQDDPGLNISQYANVSVDTLLETSRTQTDNTERLTTLRQASEIIVAERPAIFLFQPTLVYVVSDDVTLPDMPGLGRPADRFSNITDWHTESHSLWPIFHARHM